MPSGNLPVFVISRRNHHLLYLTSPCLSPQEQLLDVLRALSSPNLDIRRKTLDIALELISSRNIDEVSCTRLGCSTALHWLTHGDINNVAVGCDHGDAGIMLVVTINRLMLD